MYKYQLCMTGSVTESAKPPKCHTAPPPPDSTTLLQPPILFRPVHSLVLPSSPWHPPEVTSSKYPPSSYIRTFPSPPVPPRSPARRLDSHTGAVNVVRYNHGAKYILSGSSDRSIRLWNPVTGKEIKSYSGHGREVLALDMCASSSASIVYIGTARLWLTMDIADRMIMPSSRRAEGTSWCLCGMLRLDR